MAVKNPRKVAKAVRRLEQVRAEIKTLYKEVGELETQITSSLPFGESVKVGKGLEATLVDNFAKSNTVFRPAAVRRFEIKVVHVKGEVKPVVEKRSVVRTQRHKSKTR